MSNDLNRWQGIGRLGKDVETRFTKNGEGVASFSIACGQQWKDKSGAKQEKTEWVNITAFGKLAEICGKYLSKGSQVFVEGRLQTDKYTDKDGVERYATKVIADRLQMLGSPNRQGQAAPQEATAEAKPDFDDDIPF